MTIQHDGQCQCGAIRYRLHGEPLTLYVCHCKHCQKQSSSAFGMSLRVAPEALEIISGTPKVWTTRGESGRAKLCGFCGDCGTRIYHASEEPTEPVSIKAGTLNDTGWLDPIAHIWTKSAQAWVTIERDEYRCFEEEPDDDEELMRRYKALHHAERL